MSHRKPFPLDWPADHKRNNRWTISRSRFQVTSIIECSRSILRRAESMDFANVVISSNMPLRRDGLPYSTGREPMDCGVAVWWTHRTREQVIACDRWYTAGENVRAIELSLDAMASLDRWGASQIVERAFAGFEALPPPSASWREVFGEELETFEQVKKQYRVAMQTAHPDKGGTALAAATINNAFEEAKKEFGV
jgi:hypothetical protein